MRPATPRSSCKRRVLAKIILDGELATPGYGKRYATDKNKQDVGTTCTHYLEGRCTYAKNCVKLHLATYEDIDVRDTPEGELYRDANGRPKRTLSGHRKLYS
jgi:hypothetical protein